MCMHVCTGFGACRLAQSKSGTRVGKPAREILTAASTPEQWSWCDTSLDSKSEARFSLLGLMHLLGGCNSGTEAPKEQNTKAPGGDKEDQVIGPSNLMKGHQVVGPNLYSWATGPGSVGGPGGVRFEGLGFGVQDLTGRKRAW